MTPNTPSTPRSTLIPWEHASSQDLRSLSGVCLDIDDTFSTEGKITAEAFEALWDLKKAGFAVVPITGRPAGWCDHIARFWPVDAVVGENGAFIFYLENGIRRRSNTPGAPADPRPAIAELGRQIQRRFPEARWASDQAYREYDLAIDICEDVPPWKDSDVNALLDFCHQQGAHAKLSSIHVNAWWGDYDKRSGFQHALSLLPALGGSPDSWIYIGDSPNDEPLFGWFKNTVGVANLRPYLHRLSSPPRWITQEKSGAGFTEMARRLIESRKKIEIAP